MTCFRPPKRSLTRRMRSIGLTPKRETELLTQTTIDYLVDSPTTGKRPPTAPPHHTLYVAQKVNTQPTLTFINSTTLLPNATLVA